MRDRTTRPETDPAVVGYIDILQRTFAAAFGLRLPADPADPPYIKDARALAKRRKRAKTPIKRGA
jgi:hypothetical protein